MNKKKIVGITMSGSARSGSYDVGSQYASGIAEAGGAVVMLAEIKDKSVIDALVDMCDGILLTGGADVSPRFYGEERMAECGESCEERDSFELELVRRALEKDKPILCICRGVQLLNVAFGGSLWQDIPSQCPESICHRSSGENPATHNVEITDTAVLEKIGFFPDPFIVNSYHHQAVKEVGEGLAVFARAEGDRMVEGVYAPQRKFVLGVQWHPELWHTNDDNAKAIFKGFVDAL